MPTRPDRGVKLAASRLNHHAAMKTPIALLCAAFPVLAHAAYTASPTEAAVLEAVLQDEVSTFVAGGDTIIGASLDLRRAPAEAVARAYAHGATDTYPAAFDAAMLVFGAVQSIDRNARGVSVASFATPRPATVRAELPDGYATTEKVSLVCAKLRVINGSPTFSDCQDAAVVGEQAVKTLRADLASFYQGKPTPANVSQLAVNVSMYASLLPADHGCPDDMARCRRSVESADSSHLSEQALLATVRRFQQAGLDLSPYAASTAPATPRPR